ncbi:antitoxin [Dactylosporangium sp. CA-233914]|uniref:antitoxin n=1 Tax=Dactylosporangium sp. CA-233914 TaxID=3239934 RepID=UPI003D9464A9
MNSFFDKVKKLADEHDEKVDEALEKAGDFADDKTGGKYSEHIDKGVDMAAEHTGEGDTRSSS